VHKYDGCLIHEEKCPGEVYQIAWRPAAPGVFPDRPASPGAGQNGSAPTGAPPPPPPLVLSGHAASLPPY
jgi:hypothetical protein